MSLPKIRFFKLAAIIAVGIVFFIFIGGTLFSYYAEGKIEAELKSIGAKTGSVDLNLFTQTISIKEFEFHYSGDSVQVVPHKTFIKNLTLSGINIYQLLVHKKIEIHKITLDQGNILYNTKIKSKVTAENKSFKELRIGYLILKNIKTEIATDSLTDYSGILDVTVTSIRSSDTSSITNIKAYTVNDMEAKISQLLIQHKNGLYQNKISRVYINTLDNKFEIDSLFLQPKFAKYKFAKTAGKQTDRINVFIPRINVSGFQFDQLNDSSIFASKIEILSGEVYSFRDKRMPFKETENKPLPMEALRRLPFAVEVDTIKIKDTKITYEEFPPDGFHSGKVTFENLNATLLNLSNRVYYNKPKYATLKASASVMGKGVIQVTFLLPIEANQLYRANGKISKMRLHHLNPALENLAFVRIESGTLNEINFNFTYNDRIANGTLTINYENLKMQGLKKEKESLINNLKTFLINLVLKNDKNKGMPIEQRTGTILFERDRKRQIFNFWWKSLWSGIKTSVLSANDKKKK